MKAMFSFYYNCSFFLELFNALELELNTGQAFTFSLLMRTCLRCLLF